MFSANLSTSQYLSASFLYSLGVQEPCILALTDTNIVLSDIPSLDENTKMLEWQPCKLDTVAETRGDIVVTSEGLNLEKIRQVYEAFKTQAHLGSIHLTSSNGQRTAAKIGYVDGDLAVLKETSEMLSQQYHVDIAVLCDKPDITKPGILLMDMDSTVIQVECIDEIARLADIGEQVASVTELAMQGKLDFAESLHQRVACLKGIDESLLEGIRDRLPLMPGIMSLITELKKNGWIVAIASGGFTYFADYLRDRLSLDYATSNKLGVNAGKLTGVVEGNIVDAKVKAQTLEKLMQQYNIAPQQTIAIGDGANDLDMMQAANLGVAYHAKPIVRAQATCAVRFGGLDTVLAYLK